MTKFGALFSDGALDHPELEITTVVVDLDTPPGESKSDDFDHDEPADPTFYPHDEVAYCDLVSAIEQNTRTLEEAIAALNQLGMIVQFMSDGTTNMFGFFNSIGSDLASMTLGDKIKAISAMMKG